MSNQIQTLIQTLKDTMGNLSSRHSPCLSVQPSDPTQTESVHRTGSTQSGSVQRTDSTQSGSVQQTDSTVEPNPWDRIPTEILRDVIGRIADSGDWTERRNVVACAGVCTSWRETVFETVKPVQISGQLNLPDSLRQPGPREGFIKCFIKRDKLTQTYTLFLCLSDDVNSEDGKFLLAARKYYYPTHLEYVISMDPKQFSTSSRSCLGRVRSNLAGTRYKIYEAESSSRPNRDVHMARQTSKWASGMKFLKKSSPRLHMVGKISYKQNWGQGAGPRSMKCLMTSISTSSVLTSTTGSATNTENSQGTNQAPETPAPTNRTHTRTGPGPNDPPLSLQSKNPVWHDQLQCWYLNFSGRVTLASIKNFQLVETDTTRDQSVFMQFGKVSSDGFTMDYGYPFSAVQAFAISLTNFGFKLSSGYSP